MEEFEFDVNKFCRKNAVPLSIFILLGVTFVVYTVQRWVYAYQVEGQWVVFDSQEHMSGENNPDGFRLEVPKGWTSGAYENGGQKNMGDLRARFSDPFFLNQVDTYVEVWWRRVDESWTLEDVRDWYTDELGFGINRDVLENRRETYRAITVGVEQYPALSQIVQEYKRSNTRIVFLIVDDEAFVLEFVTTDYKETNRTFRRMLDTFEVYE